MSAAATGALLLRRGESVAAIAALRRAVAEDPGDGAAAHNLAVALRAAGELGEARVHAARAVAVTPRAESHALLASIAGLLGDEEEALVQLDRALAIEPAHAVSRYYRGVARARRGERAAAEADLRAAAEGGLPSLLRERLLGQLADLARGTEALPSSLCKAPLVSEVIDVADAATKERFEKDQLGSNNRDNDRTYKGARRVSVDEVRALVARAERIVALTGAGVSLASGLRTRKMLWREFDRDRVVSVWGFRSDPSALWTVVRDLLGDGEHEPNAAHRALASLPKLAGVITQNVDGLHQRAGTRAEVIELHGTLLATRCHACGASQGRTCQELLDEGGPMPPRCIACGDVVRPDVVLFGEWVDALRLTRALDLCRSCDLLLVAGTAADVAPAAELPRAAAAAGATVVELKHRPSRLHHALGTLHLAGAAEDLLPRLVEGRAG